MFWCEQNFGGVIKFFWVWSNFWWCDQNFHGVIKTFLVWTKVHFRGNVWSHHTVWSEHMFFPDGRQRNAWRVIQNCLRTMESSSGLLVGVCAICVDLLKRRIVLFWISIQGYELFILGMNKSVPGVKLTTVGRKIASESMVWKNTKGKKVWKRCPRYEIETQGMKKLKKVWSFYTKL